MPMKQRVIEYGTKLCVQDLCVRKTNRIDIRINPLLSKLIEETAQNKGISITDFFTKLALWYFIKTNTITGDMEEKDSTWHGDIEDMPLHMN